MILKKRPNTHPDFIALTQALDNELNDRYGKAQVAYITHNKIDPIPTAMVAYKDDTPVACGCFKELDTGVEIKRMFVTPEFRGQGLAAELLKALETWARELGHPHACLETGKKQPEAIRLYQKAGYTLIPNYGPYKGMDNSVCMKKELGDFGEKLVQILNHGALNLALGMGYAHRIFDIMDDQGAALTVEDLADLSGLSRRYLREWMGIMVTGGIVVQDPFGGFSLPPSHGDLLCRRSGSNNLGVYTQEIPLLTSCAMAGVLKGFTTGEGVPFSAYPTFQSFMTELADAKHQNVLITDFLPSVDQGRILEKLKQGIRVCDIGCGQGKAVTIMAQAFKNSEFTGIDNHGPAIAAARESARTLGLKNTAFLEADAAGISEQPELAGTFDYITAFDAIHDQSAPLQALKGVLHMLKPEGLFSMIDIKAASDLMGNMDHPMAPFLYTVSLMHCMPVGLNNKGAGLGMMWGKEKAVDLLTQAGFTGICVEDIPNDAFNLHFMCRP